MVKFNGSNITEQEIAEALDTQIALPDANAQNEEGQGDAEENNLLDKPVSIKSEEAV